MDILVAYDVNTQTPAGRRRLRHVATTCKAFGQRVQFSVFECRVDEAQYEALRARLLGIVDQQADNLRLYRLRAPRAEAIESFGRDRYTDFDDPLIL